jgi:hypothetical protein
VSCQSSLHLDNYCRPSTTAELRLRRQARLSDVVARGATAPASSRAELELRRGSATSVRSDNHINLISYAVCELFRFAAAEGMWSPDKLGLLFETARVWIRSATLVLAAERSGLRRLPPLIVFSLVVKTVNCD